jgi:short-subunit dehydrogenase
MKLKNISEQTIVITGATSGIGLATARMAAEKGARLVLIARNEDALRELADEIKSNGGQAIYFAADVADENALREAANKAKAEFGGFDTWVNNAGGSVYGRIMDVPTEDLRRLFETNLWGVVYGSRIAVENLRMRGGALINVGSEVSDAVIPLQGMYSASKHAVKAFTEALRMELEADGFPISVTVIKPTAINTPFADNAKNYLPYEPQLPQPLYAPELVAEAILHCAENPVPEFFVGEMAKIHSTMATLMPRMSEKMNEWTIDSSQNSGAPARAFRPDGLYDTNSNLRERGDKERFTLEESIYQRAKIHPILTGALALGGGLAAAALISSLKSKNEGESGFSGFRGSRAPSLNIRENMEVVGADGQHVGTVDRVEYGEIKLTRKDSPDGKHHLISTELVESIAGDKVILTQTAEQTRQMWVTVGGKKQGSEAKDSESGDNSGFAAGAR